MFKTILVPLDGSEIARGILPYVSQIARKTGTPLVLHTVIDLHSVPVSETSAIVPGPRLRADYAPVPWVH